MKISIDGCTLDQENKVRFSIMAVFFILIMQWKIYILYIIVKNLLRNSY